MIQAHWPCCLMSTFNLLHSARSLPTHIQVNPRLRALLICCHQEASLSTEHGCSEHSTVSDNKKVLASPSKSKIARVPTEGRKVKICYSAGSIRSPVPPTQTEAQLLHPAPPYRRFTSLLSKRSSTECKFITLLVLRGLPLHSAQQPSAPHCDCRRASAPPTKSGNSSPHTEERKEALAPQQEHCKG
jgi:hypothetical protein